MQPETEKFIEIIVVGTLLLLLVAAFLTSMVITHRRKHNYFLKEKELMQTKFEQELLKSQLEIQEETLKYISEEIHDNIGQVLSLAKLHLNVLPVPPAKENETSLEEVKDLVSKAINDLRHLSKSLNPDRMNELGLEVNLRHELDLLEKSGAYKTKLLVNGSLIKLESAKQIIIFRIVQEGISNILKHANANEVEINMIYEYDRFILELKDNGKGINQQLISDSTLGIGLRNMKNRATLINAQLIIENNIKKGANLKLITPL